MAATVLIIGGLLITTCGTSFLMGFVLHREHHHHWSLNSGTAAAAASQQRCIFPKTSAPKISTTTISSTPAASNAPSSGFDEDQARIYATFAEEKHRHPSGPWVKITRAVKEGLKQSNSIITDRAGENSTTATTFCSDDCK